MSERVILAIDQGTTSSRALVVGSDGRVLGTGQVAFQQLFPQPGWVEHDPSEIWSSTQSAISAALAAAGRDVRDVATIGIANQRETVVLWDRASGAPIGNAIVWQDRRTAGRCAELQVAGHEAAVRRSTGLTIDPYFSATKLGLLLQDSELRRRAEAGELAAGTVDSWLLWNLTGGQRHLTDFTNASRTLLFNIRRGRWDDSLLDLFGVPRAILPSVQPSASLFGTSSAEVVGAEIPICGIAGDQQSALFGQACLPGMAKNTYGTGCFLLANIGRSAVESQNRLLTTMGAGTSSSGPEYLLEGSVFVAGAAVQWLRDELGIIASSDDIEALAASVPDSGGVMFVPAFTGLGAPDWDPTGRGAILGLTRGTTKAHIARAALEAIALSSAELVSAMNADLATPITELRVDGGAARNNLLMQMQADFAGLPVVRPAETETTAFGAAYLAGIGAGVFASEDEVRSLWKADRTFEPSITDDDRKTRLADWRRAVERSKDWARP